ncbi:MAG: type II toxin-antitoxin system VapC family toxin [Acidobacteria bacterium]|nr:MAG: type II toxin-antitoxin system VapC family toxin [Acidobacteriota bacterium]
MIMLDTHAWLWWVSDPARLGRNAAKAIEAASQIVIGAISCFEVATAVTKGRISLDRGPRDWLEQALALPRVELVGLTPAICVKATQLGREFPGDPADRLIVATAMLESASLVTKDARIRRYPAVETIW